MFSGFAMKVVNQIQDKRKKRTAKRQSLAFIVVAEPSENALWYVQPRTKTWHRTTLGKQDEAQSIWRLDAKQTFRRDYDESVV